MLSLGDGESPTQPQRRFERLLLCVCCVRPFVFLLLLQVQFNLFRTRRGQITSSCVCLVSFSLSKKTRKCGGNVFGAVQIGFSVHIVDTLERTFSFGSVTGGQGLLRNKCHHHHHQTFSFLDFIILDGLLRIAQNEPTTSAVYSFSTLLNCCSMKNCSYETRICRVLICVVPLHFLACSASFIIY